MTGLRRPSLENVVFRVDSSRTIGTGHFIRSFALAQCLSFFGFAPTFVMASYLPEHRLLLERAEYPIVHIDLQPGTNEDAETTKALASKSDATWIILDGYSFSEAYQKRLKGGKNRIAVFDDYYGSTSYPVDIIINNNLYASVKPYQETGTPAVLLVSTRFSILRPRFLDFSRREGRLENPARRILVTIGGTDALGRTAWTLDAIQHSNLEFDNVTIIVGNGNANQDWMDRAANIGAERIRIIQATDQMPELMEWADLVITAGGTTTHELLYMGTPFITIIVAENQRLSGLELENKGISTVIDGMNEAEPTDLMTAIEKIGSSPAKMNEMIINGTGLVDGYGANRVASKIMGMKLWFRSARMTDMALVLAWANDPISRKWSFRTEPIPWEEHVKWYTGKIQDQRSRMLMAFSDQDEPVGLVRVDEVEGVGRMSINIDPRFRGLSYATDIIRVGCRVGASSLQLSCFEAYIKPGNSASLKAFQRVGFKEQGIELIDGHESHHLVMRA